MINIESHNNTVVFKGELSLTSITKSFEKTHGNLLMGKNMNFDLSQVTKIDTAGLAWILQQVEKALQIDINLQLINVPEKLLKLAKLSAVEKMLPIAP